MWCSLASCSVVFTLEPINVLVNRYNHRFTSLLRNLFWAFCFGEYRIENSSWNGIRRFFSITCCVGQVAFVVVWSQTRRKQQRAWSKAWPGLRVWTRMISNPRMAKAKGDHIPTVYDDLTFVNQWSSIFFYCRLAASTYATLNSIIYRCQSLPASCIGFSQAS